jgi:hypothetical protein
MKSLIVFPPHSNSKIEAVENSSFDGNPEILHQKVQNQ